MEVDEILQSVQGEQAEAPEGQAPAATETQAAPAQQDWRQGFQWEFDHNGKKVAPDSAEKAKTWLSQGYNYSQRAAELNKRDQEFRRQQQQLEARYKGYDRFDEVNKYASQNPDWWKHVEETWKGRQTQGVNPELQPVLNPILQRLEQTESLLGQWQQQQQQAEIQKQDQALETEIASIRKQYPNMDLSAVDESGRTLEWRVMNHANESGINSFRAAFRDYLHDKLVEEAKAQGLSTVAKTQQAAAKRGSLGTSPAPTRGTPAPSVRGRSYQDLEAAALKEFNIS